MTEQEKQAFEAWFRADQDGALLIRAFSHALDFEVDDYLTSGTSMAWRAWQAAKAQVVPQGEMFYALKDEYFEEQYFELGGVIDDFKSDYATGEICELLCADITTIKRPNKFIVTLPGGETRVFDTREEAMQAIQAAREGE